MSLQLVMIGVQLLCIALLLLMVINKVGKIYTEISKRKTAIKVLKDNRERIQLIADSSYSRYQVYKSDEDKKKFESAEMELSMINTVLNFME